MSRVHHSAICTRDVEASLAFWRDGLGFEVLLDESFDGDWPRLFGVTSTRLRSIFLGDPSAADSGIVELVDFGQELDRPPPATVGPGFFLLSVVTDLDAATARLAELGLGGERHEIAASGGVRMAVVHDPNGVRVELIDAVATPTLDRLTAGPAT